MAAAAQAAVATAKHLSDQPIPRLLLIAQPDSYRIAPFLNAARRLGLEVLIASRGEFSLISEVHNGLHINFNDPHSSLTSILKEAQQRPFAGILGCDDSTVELAAIAAQKLGLVHNPPEAARRSHRKDLARAQLSLAHCTVPIHCLIDLRLPLEPQSLSLPWPCVIKPLNLSASRGVIRANDIKELLAACERIRPIIAESANEFEQSHVLIEEYIDGVEVAYEGYLHHAQLTTLALFDKPDPLIGPYFEETIYVTPSQLDAGVQAKIKASVEQACRAYELCTGPVHAELRVNKHGAWILEVASRTIGGDCGRTLDRGGELMLEKLAISLATGKSLEAQSPKDSRGVMMIPIRTKGVLRRVEGVIEARKIPLIERVDIIIREGSKLVPLPEGNQYAGYIFAQGENPIMVADALRLAYAQLRFITAPLFEVSTV